MENIRKQVLEGQIYNVCTEEEYDRNPEKYGEGYAMISNGITYPIKKINDNTPGFHIGERRTMGIFIDPEDNKEEYDASKVIDFSSKQDMKSMIESSELLYKQENNILTMPDPDNILVPKRSEADTPAASLFKDAIDEKHIVFDNYKHRFGSNPLNDKKLIDAPDITIKKMVSIGKKFDMKISLTIEDTNPDVANPIGKTLTKILTDGGQDD